MSFCHFSLYFFSLVIYGTSNLGYKPIYSSLSDPTFHPWILQERKWYNSIVEEKNINAFVYVGKYILYKYMCDLYFSLNFSFTWFLMALVGQSDWPWHSSSRTSGRFLSSLHPNCHQWGAFCVWRWLLWQQGPVYIIFYFTSVPFVSNT